MKWIVQENMFNENAYDEFIDVLKNYDQDVSLHKVVPFIGELLPEAIVEDKKAICFGSYSMRHAAKKFSWAPGVFDLEPFDFNVQLENWGDRMLNARAIVTNFEDAIVNTAAFIRPILDSKSFAGRVFEPEEFKEWQRKIAVLEEDFGDSVNKNTLIQVCPLQKIFSEYRVWVVDGRIVTASLYKRGDKVVYSDQVDERFLNYAQECINIWKPHDAFVIDVCEVEDGYRIVEINTLNACGFYKADLQKLVEALIIYGEKNGY